MSHPIHWLIHMLLWHMLKIEIKSKTHNYKKQSRRKETKHMYPTLLLTLTTTHVYSKLSLKKNSRRYTKRTPLRTRIYIPCGGAQKTQKNVPSSNPRQALAHKTILDTPSWPFRHIQPKRSIYYRIPVWEEKKATTCLPRGLKNYNINCKKISWPLNFIKSNCVY